VLGGGADGAAVFGRDAVGLPHAHKQHFVDAREDNLARLFIEAGDFFAALHFVYAQ